MADETTAGSAPDAHLTRAGAPATADWSGHVIVCGLGGLGLRITELLQRAGARVVVLDDDPDPRLAAVVARWGVPLVDASPRFGDGLGEAGLAGAAAVICVEHNDLASLETALLVRQLRPERRVVVQLANPAVGSAVAGALELGSVLDTAALAAPAMVELCLRRGALEYELGGERFIVTTAPAHLPAGAELVSLRSLYGNVAPIAVLGAEGGLAVCPGRDHLVAEGDRVTLVGTAADLEVAGVAFRLGHGPGPGAVVPTPERARTGAGALGRRLAAVASGADRSLRLVLGALVGLFVVSTVVLRLAYHAHGQPGAHGVHLTVLESAYFTVVTMATVGFGDYSYAGQPPWLMAYGIALIVAGVALVTTAFALFTNLLVSRRIAESLGRQRVTGMAGHRVVIGLGAVGLRVVEGLLGEGCDVVVVEGDESNRYLARARALGVPVLIADATQPQALESANLASAASIAVLTSNDLTNIETALAARALLERARAEVPIVLRVFDRVLAATVETTFGFDQVRSTSELAAPWFVGAALGLEILGSFFVGRRPFVVGRLSITAGSGLDGLAMQDLPARTRVVAISRGGHAGLLEHPPRRDTRFGAGDQAYIVGPHEELLAVLLRDRVEHGANPAAEMGIVPDAPAARRR